MNLTDEQIDAAATAILKAAKVNLWHQVSFSERSNWQVMARAAAPFLQMPWEMPTPSELKAFQGRLMEQGGAHVPWQHLTLPFEKFIAERNASLIPQPVDPRREKVFRTLMCNVSGPANLQTITDRILAALDAKDGI